MREPSPRPSHSNLPEDLSMLKDTLPLQVQPSNQWERVCRLGTGRLSLLHFVLSQETQTLKYLLHISLSLMCPLKTTPPSPSPNVWPWASLLNLSVSPVPTP